MSKFDGLSVSRIEKIVIALISLFLLLVFGAAAVSPYFESQAFNRLTGANTTYWDAVFVELRVDCSNLKN